MQMIRAREGRGLVKCRGEPQIALSKHVKQQQKKKKKTRAQMDSMSRDARKQRQNNKKAMRVEREKAISARENGRSKTAG